MAIIKCYANTPGLLELLRVKVVDIMSSSTSRCPGWSSKLTDTLFLGEQILYIRGLFPKPAKLNSKISML